VIGGDGGGSAFGMKLVRYDAMCCAIAEAHAIDEVKDIRDKAEALAVYARQAKDTAAERQCREIRLRAERRAGLLLKQRSRPTRWNEGCEGRPSSLADFGITKNQSANWQRLAEVPEATFEEALVTLPSPNLDAILARANHLSQGTGDFEWVTPAEYIEPVRMVLGEIDVDPASNPTAQRQIRAKQFFTQEENGLARSWFGRVWLNPPYAWPVIEDFVEKLGEQLAAGHTTEAIMLTNNSSDTAWFQNARQRAVSDEGTNKLHRPRGATWKSAARSSFLLLRRSTRAFCSRLPPARPDCVPGTGRNSECLKSWPAKPPI
jgi:hypothetical protein